MWDLAVWRPRCPRRGSSRGFRFDACPNRFAALAPVCAFGDPGEARRIAHIPVWAFHGGKDLIVSARAGKAMVDAHRAAGGNGRWTLDPEAGHAVWEGVYPRDDLYEWFLQHRRGDATTLEKGAGEV